MPTRALVLAEAPSADAGEITDKGYINQGAVLRRRADGRGAALCRWRRALILCLNLAERGRGTMRASLRLDPDQRRPTDAAFTLTQRQP